LGTCIVFLWKRLRREVGEREGEEEEGKARERRGGVTHDIHKASKQANKQQAKQINSQLLRLTLHHNSIISVLISSQTPKSTVSA
jgi:hypothetical protein